LPLASAKNSCRDNGFVAGERGGGKVPFLQPPFVIPSVTALEFVLS